MIRIENVEISGWKAAIRGMRNPMNSWKLSDSYETHIEDPQTLETAPYAFFVGEKDLALMKKLSAAGPDHGKFLRFITVTMDIAAPLYWWKEYDTYKVGTVANSCSTMHKIHAKEFTLDDFSHEHLVNQVSGEYKSSTAGTECFGTYCARPMDILRGTIATLNKCREKFLETKSKDVWWQMIQLLPTSYNQRRTVQLNYEVLRNMYHARKNHKLDEWVEFCKWIEEFPYFKEICM